MSSNRPSDATRTRLSPEDRHQQLLRVASDIIAHDGVDNVRSPYVASAAGVTRPVVYKFFTNRHELIKGVLEDFRDDFAQRTPNLLETEDAVLSRKLTLLR